MINYQAANVEPELEVHLSHPDDPRFRKPILKIGIKTLFRGLNQNSEGIK